MVGVAGVASCWMRKTLKRRKVIWWLACSWTAGTVEDFLTVMGEGASWPSSSNVYLFRDDKGFIMVDVGCGGRVGRLLEEMRAKGVKPNDVHTVLLTHAHPDHMGGIAEFLRYAKARVIIHELEAPAAMKPEVLEERFDVHLCVKHYGSFFTGHFSLLSYFESVCPMSKVTPDETVREGDVLEFGDYSFRVLRTPGHALGHTSLYEEREGFLLSGDLIGATVAWYSPSSGGVIGYLESLRKVERLRVDRIYPSHGPEITDVKEAICRVKNKLLRREKVILQALEEGEKTFKELNQTLIRKPKLLFFPGTVILESHLIKLEREGKVGRRGDVIFKV